GQVSSSDSWKATVPPIRTTSKAVTAEATRRGLSDSITPIVLTRGRRTRRAPAQHPSGSGPPRGRLLELRQHQLLRLRVHDHLRPDRPRGGGRGRAGRRRRAREHVQPVHARAARRDERLVVEVVLARGDPESPRDDRGRLELRFLRVRLRAPAHLLSDLRAFYDRLDTGETQFEFTAGEGEPFYHFAFLAPPERFDELAGSNEVFDFDNWDARAFYFDDSAGKSVEV